MKIVFLGTADFAVASLIALHFSEHDLVGVITQPDRPKGRGHKLTAPPVKAKALKLGYQVFQPPKIRESIAIDRIKDWNPDLIIVVAYGQLLPEEILKIPPLGCINVHASLLPKYRGAAPIHRAIINGETETGVTTMYMGARLDAGDLILQEKIAIEPTITVGELHDLLAEKGAELLLETLDQINKGTGTRRPQNEDLATYAPLLTRSDEEINWSWPASKIADLVRGMNPWPGTYTIFDGKVLKVWEVRLSETLVGNSAKRLGTIIRVSERGILVKAGNGQGVLITRLQLQGKQAMPAAEFLKGNRLLPGLVLGSAANED